MLRAECVRAVLAAEGEEVDHVALRRMALLADKQKLGFARRHGVGGWGCGVLILGRRRRVSVLEECGNYGGHS